MSEALNKQATFPENWRIVSLDQVAKTRKGKKPKILGQKSEEMHIPYIDIKAFEAKEIRRYCADEKIVLCEEKDVLIVWDGARSGLVGIGAKGAVGSTIAKIEAPEIDSKFLYYFLLGNFKNLNTRTQGVGIPHINPSVFSNLKFPIVSPKQQKQIAAKIEKLFSHIDTGITALNQTKSLLKKYRQSILKAAVTGELTKQWRKQNKNKLQPANQLLKQILTERRKKWEQQQLEQFQAKGKTPKDDEWKGRYKEPEVDRDRFKYEFPECWEIVSVEQLATIGTGATPRKGKSEYYENGKIPWITSGALNDLFVRESRGFITDLAVKETNVSILPVNTLLVALYGEGKTRGKVSELLIPTCTNQACATIVLSGLAAEIRPYAKIFFQKNYDDIRRLSSGGVQPNLNLGIIKSTVFPIPCLAEQKVIIDLVDKKFDSINRLENNIECQLLKAEKNKQSILASAFSGKI